MNICVIGSGYVGLVTGACLADFGMNVVGVDKDHSKVEALSRGKVPIYEPGLDTLVQKNMTEGRLRFTTELAPAIEEAQAIFIAVGTPPKSDGSADLTFIREVAASIAEHLNGYKIIITKSTVPIGTGRMIEAIVREGTGGGKHTFAVVSNPEFLREGSAIEDFMHPDRVVIGTRDERAAGMMRDVYSPLHAADVPFIVTDVETAEMIKYASNGFLATKISFINEVAHICEAWGADVEVVSKGMGLDNRIGPKFLQAGPGYGGSCFPKDTRAAAQIARDSGLKFRIIEAVLEVNEATQKRMVEKVEQGARRRSPARRSASSASPSSRTPTTSASRRRCRSCRRWSTAAPPCAPTIPRRCRPASRCSPPWSTPATPTRRPRGPTRWSSPPSGTSSASSTSTVCASWCASRW